MFGCSITLVKKPQFTGLWSCCLMNWEGFPLFKVSIGAIESHSKILFQIIVYFCITGLLVWWAPYKVVEGHFCCLSLTSSLFFFWGIILNVCVYQLDKQKDTRIHIACLSWSWEMGLVSVILSGVYYQVLCCEVFCSEEKEYFRIQFHY